MVRWVDGPFGAFTLDRKPAAGFVFVAGGIGIAPVLSMLRTLADRGDRRPVVLFYSGPDETRLAAAITAANTTVPRAVWRQVWRRNSADRVKRSTPECWVE